jgi:hypothetical protein
MKLRLDVRGIESSPEFRDYVTRRVHFSLGRFGRKIKSLSLRLVDPSEPPGGPDKCCYISIQTNFGPKVIAHERGDTSYVAMALVLERASRAVERQLSLRQPTAKHSALPRASFQFGD